MSSNQIYKGVLTDNAKASYLSKTFVDKQAQKTDGYQLSKGILLSDQMLIFILNLNLKYLQMMLNAPMDPQLVLLIMKKYFI